MEGGDHTLGSLLPRFPAPRRGPRSQRPGRIAAWGGHPPGRRRSPSAAPPKPYRRAVFATARPRPSVRPPPTNPPPAGYHPARDRFTFRKSRPDCQDDDRAKSTISVGNTGNLSADSDRRDIFVLEGRRRNHQKSGV